MFVPPERSTSLFRCVDVCAEHGGTPACIGSAEENDFVTAEFAAAADGLRLGLYQNETGLGPAKGWGRCVASDAPTFSNWDEGQPDDHLGYQQDCAWVDSAAQDRRYREWVLAVRSAATELDRPLKVAILEVGAGGNVTTVRCEAEHVFRGADNVETTLIRVNPELPLPDGDPEKLRAGDVVSVMCRGSRPSRRSTRRSRTGGPTSSTGAPSRSYPSFIRRGPGRRA